MNDGMLCYAYVRMSSIGQIDGDSERRQLADARGWAERNGHTFVEKALRDLGVSAYRGKNQRKGAALGEFLNGVRDGKLEPGILYLEAVDRLSREPPMRILSLISDIFDTGTTIYVRSMGQIVTRENFDTTLFPSLSLMAQVAHWESRQKSERINAAIAARHERAKAGGRAKGAYHPAWVRPDYSDGTVQHVLIPEAAASIRRIFDLGATGAGTRAIARILNAETVAMPPADYGKSDRERLRAQNRRWHATYVAQLLTDRKVIGEYQPTRTERVSGKGNERETVRTVPVGDPIPDYWPRVVTLEQWDAVRANANRKLGAKVGGRKMVFTNLLTNGIARCAHCDRNMLVRISQDKGHRRLYLRCANAQQGITCENTAYARLDWLEPKLLTALGDIPWSRLIRNIPVEDETAAVTAQIEEVALQIEGLSRAGARLLKLIEQEDDPDPEYIARRREIRAEIGPLKKRRDDLIRDRDALRRNAAANAGAVDEAVELARRMSESSGTELYVIRQQLHSLLREIIEVAKLDSMAGLARVHIRGGMLRLLVASMPSSTSARTRGYRRSVRTLRVEN
jgi:DNA invertase Pin-like site-specific DNA recombinase